MSDPLEMTRREFIRTSALVTASSTLSRASELTPVLTATGARGSCAHAVKGGIKVVQ